MAGSADIPSGSVGTVRRQMGLGNGVVFEPLELFYSGRAASPAVPSVLPVEALKGGVPLRLGC